jgi:hypothetical protein
MLPEMPCALTTKMEPSLRQRSPVPKPPLDRPVVATHPRGHRLAAAIPHLDPLLVAAAIRHLDRHQATAIPHLDPLLVVAAAIRRRSQLPAAHPLRLLSRPPQAMAIVRRLNKLSGQKPINDPRHRT